jgi:hypothetical protein
MNDFLFTWQEKGSLVEQLARGIESISINVAANKKPIAVTLWYSDGSGLRIRSRMRDIAERCEAGVLEFSTVRTDSLSEMRVSLPESFRGRLKIKKMTIVEGGMVAESGVLLEGPNTEEIVVVAGAYPHTLAVNVPASVAAPNLPAFEPEYPMERYQRVDMK